MAGCNNNDVPRRISSRKCSPHARDLRQTKRRPNRTFACFLRGTRSSFIKEPFCHTARSRKRACCYSLRAAGTRVLFLRGLLPSFSASRELVLRSSVALVVDYFLCAPQPRFPLLPFAHARWRIHAWRLVGSVPPTTPLHDRRLLSYGECRFSGSKTPRCIHQALRK